MNAYVFFKKDLYKPFIDPDIDTLDGEDIKVQDYALVAKVYLNAHIESGVDLVWQLCNHIDKDWRENELVTYLVTEKVTNCICSDGCRSMCVGDIIVKGEDLYICSDCGWKKVSASNEILGCIYREILRNNLKGQVSTSGDSRFLPVK